MTGLAIYDLDRTLTRWPTYSLFLLAAAVRHAPHRLLLVPVLAIAMLLHKLGLIGRACLKDFMQRSMLGQTVDHRHMSAMSERFVGRLLRDGLHRAGIEQIERDRAEGRRLILATAAPDYYAEMIAERLRFDAAISTRCGTDDAGRIGGIDGANCYGPDKLRAIQAWMRAHDLAREDLHIRFYSDDRSDLPTFEWADEPVVVNAKPRFAVAARRRGWAVTNWAARG